MGIVRFMGVSIWSFVNVGCLFSVFAWYRCFVGFDFFVLVGFNL